jgi:hypothetical protein
MDAHFLSNVLSLLCIESYKGIPRAFQDQKNNNFSKNQYCHGIFLTIFFSIMDSFEERQKLGAIYTSSVRALKICYNFKTTI